MSLEFNAWLGSNVIAKNDENIKNLTQVIKKNSAAFVLGAGLSVPVGLPNWNQLISKCFSILLQLLNTQPGDKNYSLDIKKLVSSNNQRLIRHLIKYLSDGQGNLGTQTDLLELGQYLKIILEKSLFLDNNLILGDVISRAMIPDAAKISDYKNTALYKCTKLLKTTNHGGISDIITYNFDTILEYILQQEGIGPAVSQFGYRPIRKRETDTIYIYHVHGCSPTKGYEAKCNSSKSLILDEDSYYEEEDDVYCWSNTIQSILLQRKTCVLLGFSAHDYNFKRLIKYWRLHKNKIYGQHPDSRQQHYLFFPLEDIMKEVQNIVPDGNPDGLNDTQINLLKKMLINYLLYFKKEYWNEYGIIPIWTSYEELPNMLDMIGKNIS